VALASIIVYPDLASIAAAFPHLDPKIVRNDLGYPAMLVFLPHGMLGLMVASLAAAYMSTISTHLNWGSSYIVDDFYRRFISPGREDRHYVAVGRVATVVLVILSAALSLWLESALETFKILLQIGAGTGLIFLLRWFWWRINAWSEISGMIISLLVAVYFQFVHTALGFAPLDAWATLLIGVALTTVGWVTVTLLTPPAATATLQSFYDQIRPFGHGWRKVVRTQAVEQDSPAAAFACWFLGCVVVYGALFGTGFLLYGRTGPGVLCVAAALLGALGLFRMLPRVTFE
jgi:solute:Na+ symporter, SSS family